MTQRQENPPTPEDDVDTLAREYIQALESGDGKQAIRERPATFGPWESHITHLERVYFLAKESPAAVIDAVVLACKTDEAFAALMQMQPEEEEIIIPDDLSLPPLPAHVTYTPEQGANACKFLDTYVPFSREASPEAHDDYHPFIGMWVMSATAGRRVFLKLRRHKIYGNLMIGLFGETSLIAKSTTAGVGKELLEAAGLKHLVGPDKITPAKLLSDMSGSHLPTDYATMSSDMQRYIEKKLATAAQEALYFDEMGKFIQGMLRKGSSTTDFADLFLTLDACPSEYENSTIARSGEPIKQPFLTLIGPMTPNNLKESAKAGSDLWGEGLWGRFSIVAAPEVTEENLKDAPLSADDLPIPDDLIKALQAWNIRLGVPRCNVVLKTQQEDGQPKTSAYVIEREELQERACIITQDAWQAWANYRSVLRHMLVRFPHKDFHGSYARLPETALRMAVLMASLENDNRIELKHWVKAQELAEILRKGLHELYGQVNKNVSQSPKAKLEETILVKMRYLRDKGMDGITVAKLQGSYLKSDSVEEIAHCMDALAKEKLVEKKKTPHAPDGKWFLK